MTPTTEELAERLAAACRSGQRATDAMQLAIYAPDAVSVEPFAPGVDGPESFGLAAIRAKNARWFENHEIHSFVVEGPYVHSEKFSVVFAMDVTPIDNPSRRMQLREIALYTTANGKIVREEFFGPPMV